MVRGEPSKVPEEWEVNPDEKTNLYDWLGENGTVSEFQYFAAILNKIQQIAARLIDDEHWAIR